MWMVRCVFVNYPVLDELNYIVFTAFYLPNGCIARYQTTDNNINITRKHSEVNFKIYSWMTGVLM